MSNVLLYIADNFELIQNGLWRKHLLTFCKFHSVSYLSGTCINTTSTHVLHLQNSSLIWTFLGMLPPPQCIILWHIQCLSPLCTATTVKNFRDFTSSIKTNKNVYISLHLFSNNKPSVQHWENHKKNCNRKSSQNLVICS